MKKFIFDFFQRGLVAAGFGPVILAVIYFILQQNGVVETLTVNEVCTGIFSVTALAFLSGAINAIHQVERIPLMTAILIHGIVLYFGYLAMYLLNDWLEIGMMPILLFTGIFVVGYFMIWMIIIYHLSII